MPQQDWQTKCLFFDIFGTCVDWRKTVTDTLLKAANEALKSNKSAGNLTEQIHKAADKMTEEAWGEVAHEWRNSYFEFTKKIADDPSQPYKTVDQHYHDSFREILHHRNLLETSDGGSLWDADKMEDLSLIWHYLDPWPDTAAGIRKLNERFTTCTLGNGNVSLLRDMAEHGKMEFEDVYSSEMFDSYKPSPKVYLGAAKKMGLEPSECCMVAAHLIDLKGAKENGFRTVYVERPLEERNPDLRDHEGIVDVWVKQDENGLLTAAERLGI